MPDRPMLSAAASIYPNLPSDDRRLADWTQRPRERTDVAEAMYSHLRPPPQPKPQPVPRPVRSKQWLSDWSEIDPGYARLVHFIPTNK